MRAETFTVRELEDKLKTDTTLRALANLYTQYWTEYQTAGGRRVSDFSGIAREAIRQWTHENFTFRANQLKVAKGYDGLGLYRRDGYIFAIYDQYGRRLLGVGGAPRDPYYTTERPRNAVRIGLPDGRVTEVLAMLQQIMVDEPLEELQILKALLEHHELLINEVKRDWDYGQAIEKELRELFRTLVLFWIADAAADVMLMMPYPHMKLAGGLLKTVAKALGLGYGFIYFGHCAVALVQLGYHLSRIRLDENGQPATRADQYALHEAAVNMRVLLVAYAALLAGGMSGKLVGKVKALFLTFPFDMGGPGPTAFATSEGFKFWILEPADGKAGGGRRAVLAESTTDVQAKSEGQEGGGEADATAKGEKSKGQDGKGEKDGKQARDADQQKKREQEREKQKTSQDQTGRELEQEDREELKRTQKQGNEMRSRRDQTLRTWLRAVLERYIQERKSDENFSDGQANALRARLEDVLQLQTQEFLRLIGLDGIHWRLVEYYTRARDGLRRAADFHQESLKLTSEEPVELAEAEARAEVLERTYEALVSFVAGQGEAASEGRGGLRGTVGNKKLDIAQAFFGKLHKMVHYDSSKAMGWVFHTLKSIFYREAMVKALPQDFNIEAYEGDGRRVTRVPSIEEFTTIVNGMLEGATERELELLLDRFSVEVEIEVPEPAAGAEPDAVEGEAPAGEGE